MSVYRESSSLDGSIVNRGMTDADWLRLHSRVIPNPISIDNFKIALSGGTLQDQYLSKDLHKIMQELREILREHGELRIAATFPMSGRKADMARAAAAAVLVLSKGVHELPRTSPGAEGAAPLLSSELGSPTLESPMMEATPATAVSHPLQAAGARVPITDHIVDDAAMALHLPSVLPARTVPPALRPAAAPQQVQVHRPSSIHSTPTSPARQLSATIAQNAAAPSPPPPPMAATASAAAAAAISPPLPRSNNNSATAALSSSTAVHTDGGDGDDTNHASSVKQSTGTVNELAQLNERSPPFASIINVMRRLQLRYGSHPLKFEIPVQYAQAVANRRLRVHLVPLKHPNHPAKWPTAKEIVVYVNGLCVTTPWRRAWPERKVEVAKTFLPLDITHFLNKNLPAQRLQVDVFNKEYFTPAALVIVQPFTLEEVVERMVLKALGDGRVATVESLLCRARDDHASPNHAAAALVLERIAKADAELQRFYKDVMEEDVGDGLEVADPIVMTKCPISQMPINIPIRGSRCRHLQCVDLESYLVSCHKGSYWNCALCDCEERPGDVVFDTVLWRYFLQCRGGGEGAGLPPYLRLSAAASGGSVSVYGWNRASLHGGDDEVVVDEDDDDNNEEEEEASSSMNDATTPPQPAIKRESSSSDSAECPSSGGGHAAQGKRPRSWSPPAEAEGSADNPIEL